MIKNLGSYDVVLPKSRIGNQSIFLKEFTIHQDVMQHDMAQIRIAARDMDRYQTLASGTPIRVDWKAQWSDSPKTSFYGYVSNIRPVEAPGRRYEFDLIAVSASRVFRKVGQEVWRGKSAPEIVSIIGRSFGFKVITINHPLRRTQVVQAGRTYWELMTDLADEIGYGLSARGTNLLFMPISSFVDAGVGSAPILSMLQSGPSQSGVRLRVETLTAMTGSTAADPRYANEYAVVTAVDPVLGNAAQSKKGTGSALKRKRQPPAFTSYTSGVAHSRRDAELLADGKAQRGLMSVDAEVHCAGSADLAPYRPVYLEARDRDLTGWWIVKSAKHHFSRETKQYTCDLVVSTDSLGKSSIGPRTGARTRSIGQEVHSGWSPTGLRPSRLRDNTAARVSGDTEAGSWSWVSV